MSSPGPQAEGGDHPSPPRAAGRRACAFARVVLAAAALGLAGCAGSDRPIRAALRQRLESPRRHGGNLEAQLQGFYRARDFRPGWTTRIGARREAFELAVTLDRALHGGFERDVAKARRLDSLVLGLRPSLFGPAPDPVRLAELEELLTQSYLAYAGRLLGGRVRPRDLPIDWRTGSRRADLARTLEDALRRHRVAGSLRRLEPQQPGYEALRLALARYRAIVSHGGWPGVSRGAPLAIGSVSARVAALRQRLAAEDLVGPAPVDSTEFDQELKAAVLRFQRRYGLDTTGIVDADDIANLDLPADRRARQIELNLERWHWIADTLGDRYVMVNIPDYSLRVVERGRTVIDMRVVVGRAANPTPVFSAALGYVVFNPRWNVPARIAANEVLAEIQKDPDYLMKNDIRVFDGPGLAAQELDAYAIPWQLLSPEDMPYSFRQDPGPANPVGHVKFMCPNPFDVYLHDTPTTHLFKRRERAFSHGCIRVEKPLELAEYLLRNKPGWDRRGIEAAIDTSRNQAVTIPDPLPVHLFYFTAWVDRAGEVEFRPDIYGLDELLDRALRGERLPGRAELDTLRAQNSRVRSTWNPSDR